MPNKAEVGSDKYMLQRGYRPATKDERKKYSKFHRIMPNKRMTPEAQRIAIAKSCGAKIISKRFEDGNDGSRRIGKKWAWDGNEATPCSHPGGGFFGWGWNREASSNELPDYLNDLNAMHKAKKKLTKKQRTKFVDALLTITTGLKTWADLDVHEDLWFMTSATALQEAEAFLKAIQ